MRDFMYGELLRQEQERNESERPRVHIPQPSPEYLRYLEEEAEKRKDAEKESKRGVIVFQM